MQRIVSGRIFGVLECDIDFPSNLREQYANFPPIFKNVNVSRDDIGPFMKGYAEQHGLLKKERRMLISSFHQTGGMFITPLIQFYVKLGANITNIRQFVEYTPEKCFKPFVQSVVNARREGDQNKSSAVLAETMKLLANSSYGRLLLDRSKHRTTAYVNTIKADQLINKANFHSYNAVSEDCFEISSLKYKIVHKEPIVLGFFILGFAKLRMLEVYYKLLFKFLDHNLFEEIEMDTDSLYLALGRPTLVDCIHPDRKRKWEELRANDCRDDFEADSIGNFLPRTCCQKHAIHDKRTQGLFKTEFRATEMVALCSKTYCCTNVETGEVKFISKGLNKRFLEEPLAKYRKVMEEREDATSTNRGFRVLQGAVRTYKQVKRGLSFFYPKRKVLEDGIHTVGIHTRGIVQSLFSPNFCINLE